MNICPSRSKKKNLFHQIRLTAQGILTGTFGRREGK